MLESVVDHDVALGDVTLAGGTTLPDVVARVTVYGQPRDGGANVVFAPHALTGSSRIAEWWGGLIGPGALFDTERWCVVGINALGGCYGSTGPQSIAPDGRRYGSALSDRHRRRYGRRRNGARCEALGIERLAVVIGGSLGGFQALSWARRYGAHVDHAIVDRRARSSARAGDRAERPRARSDSPRPGLSRRLVRREPGRGPQARARDRDVNV